MGLLATGLKVGIYRNLLIVNKDTIARKKMNPGILSMYILHAKMHMHEKLIQQLIITDMLKLKHSSDASLKA